MQKLLIELINDKKMTSIYTDVDNYDCFAVGYIVTLKNKKILVFHIGSHGEDDGYSVINIEDIYRIETESKYINKLKALCNVNLEEKIKINTTDDLLMDLLNAAIHSQCIITLSLNHMSNLLMGYVIKIEDNKVYMLQIDQYGEDDGHTVFFYDEIQRAMIGDIEAREIDRLYKKAKAR